MPREDWRHRHDEPPRPDPRGRDDFGEVDYSSTYGFDPRRDADSASDWAFDPRRGPPRSWIDRAGALFSGAPRPPYVETRPPRPRRGPSDRVLWTVIVERLEDERGLDLSDVDVTVEDAEVTLSGVVRRRADKRRIEDVADIDGVRHVQNNLRVRDHTHWTFL